MITITFKVDTDEHGKVLINAPAQGIGSLKETEMAVAVFEAGKVAYEAITELGGGKPRTTMSENNHVWLYHCKKCGLDHFRTE